MANFIVLDIEEDLNIRLILGMPFLGIGRAFIDVYNGKMILRVDNEHVIQYIQGNETPINFRYLWPIHLLQDI